MLDETSAEEVVEKEIDLSATPDASLSQAEQVNPEANILKPKTETKFVSKKPIAELLDANKATIIANHQNGINQPFDDVKQYKNGKYRIVKPKDAQPQAEKKVYYSDNKLLFEHVIELDANVDRLRGWD